MPPTPTPANARSSCLASCSGRAEAWRAGGAVFLLRTAAAPPSGAARLHPHPHPCHARGRRTSSFHPPAATWRDYLPRIVDSIPRRVPEATSASSSSPPPPTLPSAAGAADAARRLFFPESLADPASLTIPVLIFGALAAGVAVEVAAIALRTLPGAGGGGGEGGGGGQGAAATDTTASLDEWDEEAGGDAAGGGWGPPQAPATPADRAAVDAARDRVMGERYRGLAWLAGAAGLALFSAGLLTGSDRPLQP